ncbi:MAG: hypothetical protein QG639_757 [Patescibacteria group bacterium]|nr:hypothetical protein [Patescibacteria group bacterium]
MVNVSETLRNLNQVYGKKRVETKGVHPVQQQRIEQTNKLAQDKVVAHSIMRHIIDNPESVLANTEKKSKKKGKKGQGKKVIKKSR